MQTIQKQLNAWPLLSINLPSNWEDNIQIKTTEEPSKVTCEQYVLIPQEKQVFSDSPSGRINWYKPLWKDCGQEIKMTTELSPLTQLCNFWDFIL